MDYPNVIQNIFFFTAQVEVTIQTFNKKCYLLSHVILFATPWIVALQVSLLREFSWQEYWSGLPFPSPGDLPDPETEPGSHAL